MNESHTRQMIGSLIAAIVIVAVTIAVVTATFGPTSAAERDLEEERLEQREERREEREERREERQERREDQRERRERSGSRPPRLPAARCPTQLQGCVSVTGRVMLVESVDPDGDGDLHVVLAGRHSVTAPGLAAVDIRAGLRPPRDPRIGELMSAAGQVQRGSLGQDQIHAVQVRHAR